MVRVKTLARDYEHKKNFLVLIVIIVIAEVV